MERRKVAPSSGGKDQSPPHKKKQGKTILYDSMELLALEHLLQGPLMASCMAMFFFPEHMYGHVNTVARSLACSEAATLDYNLCRCFLKFLFV